MADGKASCGPDFAYSFHGMDNKPDMTRVYQTWMCLRCQSLVDRVWFIGMDIAGDPLFDSNKGLKCRSCGSGNLNLGQSSVKEGWQDNFLVMFGEESV